MFFVGGNNRSHCIDFVFQDIIKGGGETVATGYRGILRFKMQINTSKQFTNFLLNIF